MFSSERSLLPPLGLRPAWEPLAAVARAARTFITVAALPVLQDGTQARKSESESSFATFLQFIWGFVPVSQQPTQRSSVSGQWSASTTQISTTVEDDTVILDTASGKYFSLEGVGSLLWEALRERRSFGELLETVVERYDVGAETAERDVRALLGDLEEAGLVTRG